MLVMAMAVLLWRMSENRRLADLLPSVYGEVTVRFKSSAAFGPGPGGYDVILVVYSLTEDIAAAMAEGGAEWLEQADYSANRPESQRLGSWLPTPIDGRYVDWADSRECATPSTDGRHACPGVAAYLGGYDFLEEIPVRMTQEIDSYLFRPGSYISKRRLGYLIVSPKAQTAIFVHAG